MIGRLLARWFRQHDPLPPVEEQPDVLEVRLRQHDLANRLQAIRAERHVFERRAERQRQAGDV